MEEESGASKGQDGTADVRALKTALQGVASEQERPKYQKNALLKTGLRPEIPTLYSQISNSGQVYVRNPNPET